MNREEIKKNTGLRMAQIGLCMIGVALMPVLVGMPLDEVLKSTNGLFVAVGIGAVLAGAKNMPKK